MANQRIVEAHLPAVAEVFGDACHRATGGNPFFLGELLVELAADGVRGAAADADRVLEFGSERVGRAGASRLRRLPPTATTIASAVAVLGPATSLPEVAALAACDMGSTAAAADALVKIGVLTVEPVLDFVHPVVRGGIYEQISPFERQTLHAAAAERLTSQDARNERVARHLLRLPPAQEPARAAILRAAARVVSDHRRRRLARLDGVPPPGDDRRHPRRPRVTDARH